MRLVRLLSDGGVLHINPDRVDAIAHASTNPATTRIWAGGDKDPFPVRGTTAEVAALLSAEPPPVVYVCRECLEAVHTEAGRCAECDAEVVAVSGAESAATLLRWLGEARVERPATGDEMPFGGG